MRSPRRESGSSLLLARRAAALWIGGALIAAPLYAMAQPPSDTPPSPPASAAAPVEPPPPVEPPASLPGPPYIRRQTTPTWDDPYGIGIKAPPAERYEKPPLFLPYNPEEPIPSGYSVVSAPTRAVTVVGFGLAGLSYGLALIPVIVGRPSRYKSESFLPLVLPVVGPFVAIDTANPDDIEIAGFIALGAAQVTGYVLGVVGLLTQGERLKRTSSAPSIVLAPGAPGAGFGGLSMQAAF